MKSQVLNKVITIHPVGNINLCTKCYGNPSNVPLWTTMCTSWWRKRHHPHPSEIVFRVSVALALKTVPFFKVCPRSSCMFVHSAVVCTPTDVFLSLNSDATTGKENAAVSKTLLLVQRLNERSCDLALFTCML